MDEIERIRHNLALLERLQRDSAGAILTSVIVDGKTYTRMEGDPVGFEVGITLRGYCCSNCGFDLSVVNPATGIDECLSCGVPLQEEME